MSQAFTTVRYWLRFRNQERASETKSLLELTSLFIIISTCNAKYVYIIFCVKIWKVFLILIKYRQHAKPQPSVGHCARTKSHVSRWKVTIKRLSGFDLQWLRNTCLFHSLLTWASIFCRSSKCVSKNITRDSGQVPCLVSYYWQYDYKQHGQWCAEDARKTRRCLVRHRWKKCN